MKNKVIMLLAAVLMVAACGDSEGEAARRDQQNYEVVQEGAAAGVASTITPVGEAPPLAPVTGTNADTTTAFTIPGQIPPTTSTQPGTLAGTLPPPAYGSYPGNPPRPRTTTTAPQPPAPSPQPTYDPPPTPTPVPSSPEPEPEPVPTETSSTQPADEPEEDQPEPSEPAPPPPSDTQPPPGDSQPAPGDAQPPGF